MKIKTTKLLSLIIATTLAFTPGNALTYQRNNTSDTLLKCEDTKEIVDDIIASESDASYDDSNLDIDDKQADNTEEIEPNK